MQSSDTEAPSQQPIFNRENLHQPLIGSSYEPTVSEDTLSIKPSLPPQIHLFKSQVILNPTISKVNFVAFLVFSTYLAFIMLPAGLLTLPLLKIVYSLSESEAINASTITQVCTMVYKFFAYPLLGALCDKYGRKPFIIIGVVLLNLGIFLMPNLPNIYPFYIFASILQDLGLLCLSIPPLLADYIDYETKGRVAGITGVLASLMSFISTFVTAEINVQDNIPSEYHYIGMAGLGLGIIIIFGLKGGPYHRALFYDKKAEEAKQKAAQMIQEEKRRESEDHGSIIRNGIGSVHQDSENIPFASHESNEAPQLPVTDTEVTGSQKPGFKAGIREAQRNPWILVGLLCNFVNMGVLVMINGTLVNYVPAITGNEDDANQAYNLINKEVLAALISAFFFGYALDKLDKFKILVSSMSLSIVAVVVLLISSSPYGPLAYISMACFGVSTAGVGTFTSQALSKYPDPKYRASVGGVGGICSMLGMLWIGLIGTSLSQFNPRIPFYLHVVGAIIVLCAIVRIYISKKDIMSKL